MCVCNISQNKLTFLNKYESREITSENWTRLLWKLKYRCFVEHMQTLQGKLRGIHKRIQLLFIKTRFELELIVFSWKFNNLNCPCDAKCWNLVMPLLKIANKRAPRFSTLTRVAFAMFHRKREYLKYSWKYFYDMSFVFYAQYFIPRRGCESILVMPNYSIYVKVEYKNIFRFDILIPAFL